LDELTATDVAAMLDVSTSRVRELIAAGELRARKLGGRWILARDDVDVLALSDRAAGRPWSPRMAWGYIAIAEGTSLDHLTAPERSRLRRRVQEALPIDVVARLARRRAETHGFQLHAGLLRRALDWPGAVATGISATGHDLLQGNTVEIYVREDDLDKMIRTFKARPATTSPNLVVHVPAIDHWPFRDKAGSVTVALDLWAAGDARSRRTATRMFARTVASQRASASKT
jgi:excisionase family DNA binding protein